MRGPAANLRRWLGGVFALVALLTEGPGAARPAEGAGEDGAVPHGLLPSLQSVIAALGSSPGRKVVLVFSVGVPAEAASGIDSVALAAAGSHAVVHAFGLAGGRDDPDNLLDTNALDRLARAAGGTFSMLGRSADPARAAVIDIGRGADATESARTESAESAARNLEAQRVLAKAVDYVAGYQRQYSMLVAEERHVQRTRTEQQTLRSDVLLVRPPGLDAWVSFRDVFEVNGRPVRDREDRLKRLFLDGSPEALKQLAETKVKIVK